VLNTLKAGSAKLTDIKLDRFETLSDIPWTWVNRQRFIDDHAPRPVRFVCTMRDRKSWVSSMIAHGSAGGAGVAELMMAKGLIERAQEKSVFPWTRVKSQGALERFYDFHHSTQCNESSLDGVIRDADSSETKWRTLCSLIKGAAVREQCDRAYRDRCWPSENTRTGRVQNCKTSCKRQYTIPHLLHTAQGQRRGYIVGNFRTLGAGVFGCH
jgi:hypothetical protein